MTIPPSWRDKVMKYYYYTIIFIIMLHIVDLWQYYVWKIRSGVTLTNLFMVLYMCWIYRCRLHVVLWSHIGILILLLAVRQDFYSPLCLCGHRGDTVFNGVELALFSMMWNWRDLRAGPTFFYWPKLVAPFFSSMVSLHNWYCGAEVFGLKVWNTLPALHCRPL